MIAHLKSYILIAPFIIMRTIGHIFCVQNTNHQTKAKGICSMKKQFLVRSYEQVMYVSIDRAGRGRISLCGLAAPRVVLLTLQPER